MDIRKLRDKEWYGASSMLRNPSRFSIVLCKSFVISSHRHAYIILLRETLLRSKEFDVKHIVGMDHKKKC